MMCCAPDTLFVIVVCIFSIVVQSGITEAAKCCTPDQWQSSVYFDWAQVFIDDDAELDHAEESPETLYVYYNASGKVAYDYVNQRTFMHLSGFELSPLIPKPAAFDAIILNDYNHVR